MKKTLLTLLCLVPWLAMAQTLESFEGAWTTPVGASDAGGPAGWAIVNAVGPGQKWEHGSGGSYSGSHHAVVAPENVATGTFSDDWLITPQTLVPVNGALSFYSKLAAIGNQGNTLKVMVKTGGNATLANQTSIAEYTSLAQWTELEINPVQTQWTQKTVSLANFAGQMVYIAFVMQGDDGDSWMIDNVNIAPTCPMPTSVTLTNISITSATISWISPPDVTEWEIEIVPVTVPPTGTGMIVTGNPFTITGLSGGAYNVYIRAVCGDGNTSIWTPPVSLVIPVCLSSSQCQYTFNLTDTGANGWNGNTMSVKQNGITVAVLGMESGSASAVALPLCSDIPFQLLWNEGGTLSGEVGVSIVNVYDQTVYTKPAGEGSQNTLLFQGMTECMADGCYAPYNVGVTPQGTSAIINWQDSTTGPWQYCLIEGITSEPAVATTPPTGTSTTKPFTLNNLTPNTAYTIWVRTVCSSWGTTYNTEWSAPVNFSIGTGNYIVGDITVDGNGDGGCDGAADFGLAGAEIIVNNGTTGSFSVFANGEGEFIIDNLPNGTGVAYTFELGAMAGFEGPDPITVPLDFPSATPPGVNMCLQMPANPVNDISVFFIPVNNAQAGFDANYAIVVQNNTPLPATNVMVALDYSSDNIAFLSANSPATVTDDTITFTIGTVPPLGSSTVNALFNVLAPPLNIGGELLEFTINATMDATDAVPENNTYYIGQLIVNAFDPNDITVHEGAQVLIAQEDRYLHYTIRFQNTGTAPAVNVIVENQLDTNLDWATFDPITASHDFTAVRSADGLVTFTFNNIFLADSTSSEPASHGYVTYRIKPNAPIVEVGDEINSFANIYFDYNEPVTTNTATTIFVETLYVEENQLGRVVLYPNPVKDILYVNTLQNTLQSVGIYDVNGRLCITSGSQASIDTKGLSPGMYLVKATTDKGTAMYKLIKQ